jgi:hypothetical protein
MAKTVANQRSYSDSTGAVWFSPIGTTQPTTPTAAYGVGWNELGLLTDKGIIEAAARQSTSTWNWQGNSQGRTLYTQPTHSFQIECNEENSHVLRLARPGSTVVATGGTAEQQTINFTGTGTAGTWTDTWNGLTASGLAYNIATAALATALSSAWGITVTVTGTAGVSYVVTFPAGLGNVAMQSVNTSGISGVTSSNVVETVPGVNGINSTNVKAYTGTDFWQFGIDLVDGNIHKRYIVPQGDAVLTGNISYVANALTVYNFTINCYPDSTGTLVIDLNDNPALSAVI